MRVDERGRGEGEQGEGGGGLITGRFVIRGRRMAESVFPFSLCVFHFGARPLFFFVKYVLISVFSSHCGHISLSLDVRIPEDLTRRRPPSPGARNAVAWAHAHAYLGTRIGW